MTNGPEVNPPVSGKARGHAVMIGLAMMIVMAAAMMAWHWDSPVSMYVRDGFAYVSDRAVMGISDLDIAGRAGELRAFGAIGVLIVIAIYAVAVVLAAPASVLTFAATLAYGLWAIPITWAGALLGQTAAFAIARRCFARHIGWMCARFPVTRGIEDAVATDGLKLVLLMRQSPIIPFAAQNYMFGMLATRPRDYLIGSALGIIPGTIAKVVLIRLAGEATSAGADMLRWLLIGLSVAATVWVTLVIARHVRQQLDATLA